MPRRLCGWLALNGRERAQFLGLAVSLAVVHASLAMAGYARTRRCVELVSGGGARRVAGPDDLQAARLLARLAQIAGRHGPVRASCLRQALVLYGWLRRRGLNPEIVIGVRRDRATPLDAHAWVEVDGLSLDVGGVSAAKGSEPALPKHVPLRRAGERTRSDGARG